MTAPADRCEIDMAELRRLAEAATPGPWTAYGLAVGKATEPVRWGAHKHEVAVATYPNLTDAAFIAAANPAAIIALVAEALASRALLREAERNVAIVGPRSRDLDLAARIQAHLRSKP